MKLILLPGMDGTGDLFEPFLRALGGSSEAVVIRYPTHAPLGYAELLSQVRAELPESGPFVLLGESFSGPLAIMSAAEAPAGLAGVILCASFARNPIKWLPRFARSLVRSACFQRTPHTLQIRALLGRYSTPELQALLVGANSAVSPSVMAARARAILAVDVLAQFKACPCPILYLQGLDDRVVRDHVVKLLVRERPSMHVVILPAPHLVLQVAPAESARAICDFIASLDKAQISGKLSD